MLVIVTSSIQCFLLVLVLRTPVIMLPENDVMIHVWQPYHKPAGLSNVNIYFSRRSNYGYKLRKTKTIMKSIQVKLCFLTWIITIGLCPSQATGSIVLCDGCRPREMKDAPGRTRKSHGGKSPSLLKWICLMLPRGGHWSDHGIWVNLSIYLILYRVIDHDWLYISRTAAINYNIG